METSELERLKALLAQAPPIREEAVARIRELVLAGGYPDPKELDLALSRLIAEELGPQGVEMTEPCP